MGRGRHHDHALSGEWADYRDCHVKPDLVLVFTDGVRAMPCASEENGGPCRRPPAAWPARRVTSSPDHSPVRGPGKPPSSHSGRDIPSVGRVFLNLTIPPASRGETIRHSVRYMRTSRCEGGREDRVGDQGREGHASPRRPGPRADRRQGRTVRGGSGIAGQQRDPTR